LLPPADFDAAKATLNARFKKEPTERDTISYLLYQKVYLDYADHRAKYSDVSVLPTPVFFFGLERGEEVNVEIEPGKTLVVKFLTVGDPHADGKRQVFFELNGQPREVMVQDRGLVAAGPVRVKAEPGNSKHIAAPMPGAVVSITVAAGDTIAPGQKLVTLEAMKMETNLVAERAGKVQEVLIRPGTAVDGGDLLIRLE
jgi:pyruvate carboxylase